MTVADVAHKMGLVEIYSGESADREVTGCYTGDLLSLVMSSAKSGDAWITIQTNINVPAVASLCDVSMIIIAEGMQLDKNAEEKAKREGICVYRSEKSAFALCVEINECL